MPTISFSGIASGIDGDSVIKALTDARRLANAPLQAKVQDNDDETKAFGEFSTKLLTLNDTLKEFMTLAGGGVSKTASVSNEDALGVSAGSLATSSTTTLQVLKLAKSGSITFADTFTNPDSPLAPNLGGASSIEVTVGTGANAETHSLEITSETTVTALVNKLNDVSPGKLRAALVNIGSTSSPQYKIVLSGQKMGTENGSISVSPGAELNSLGILQVGSTQDAEDAVINVQGLGNISRQTNQITDILPGVTLDLKQENTGPIIVSINNDGDKTAKKFENVITALNEVIKYSKDNSKIERVENSSGATNKFGTLARSDIDNRAVEALKSALATANSNVEGSSIRVFADLGISTERDGTLKFDATKFSAAIAADPAAVDKLLSGFADDIASTNGVVNQYTGFQGAISQGKSSNDEETKNLNEKISRLEASIAKQTETLKKAFTNLERTVSDLKSSGDALTALINGLASSSR